MDRQDRGIDNSRGVYPPIQIGFTFLVPAHPGSPGKRAVKRVCVCVSRLYTMVGTYDLLKPFKILAALPLDPSLYLALHTQPWLRMSQSYDLSDVDNAHVVCCSDCLQQDRVLAVS